MKHLVCLLAGFGLLASGQAQTTIDWLSFDAGWGAQNSAAYIINSTVGQPDVGASVTTSANYRIVPGFWALENLGPASSLPDLSIVLNGPRITLSWPSPSTDFVLQQTDSLDALPASWSNTPGSITDNGVLKTITLPHDVAKRFYRLRRGP
jgi:hypothetical protein